MKWITFLFMLILSLQASISQNESEMEEILEEYSEGEQGELVQVLEELFFLFERPVHFNHINRELIMSIPFLSDIQSSYLLAYKDTIKYPDWEEIFILITASEMQQELLPLIIHIEDPSVQYLPYKYPVSISMISSFWGNTKNSAGFIDNGGGAEYSGSPLGTRIRAQASNRNFTIKAISESDPGESGFSEADHRSAGIAVHPARMPFSLYFGDYNFTAGMGIGFATKPVFSSWKAEPQLQVRQRSAYSLHGGTDENRFLRGGAAQFKGKRLTARFFVSSQHVDATIKNPESSLRYISGIYSSGLHRSGLEKQKKDVVYEDIQGIEWDYSGERFEAGNLFAKISLSESFKNPNGDKAFLNEASRHSVWGRVLLGKGMIMGELSLSSSGGSALSLAYSGFNKSGFSYLVSYEMVEPNFFSYRSIVSSAIIKSDGDQEGRLNILFQPRKKWGVQTDLLMKGINDAVLDNLEASYKFRSRFFYDLDIIGGEWIFQNSPGVLMSSIKIRTKDRNKRIYWQGEMGLSSSDISGITSKPGTFLSTRIRYKNLSDKITAQAGLSLFTGNDNSAVFYTYEPDLYYGMSLPALSGTGARVFLLISYNIIDDLRIEFKVSRIDYDDRSEIGTGCDKILSNQRTGLKVQVVYKGK